MPDMTHCFDCRRPARRLPDCDHALCRDCLAALAGEGPKEETR